MLGIMPADRQEMQKLDAQTHRRTGENKWKEAGGPASSSLLTAVRLCVCFLLAILLAVQGAVAQLGEHLVCNQGVVGSNPIRSTDRMTNAHDARR